MLFKGIKASKKHLHLNQFEKIKECMFLQKRLIEASSVLQKQAVIPQIAVKAIIVLFLALSMPLNALAAIDTPIQPSTGQELRIKRFRNFDGGNEALDEENQTQNILDSDNTSDELNENELDENEQNIEVANEEDTDKEPESTNIIEDQSEYLMDPGVLPNEAALPFNTETGVLLDGIVDEIVLSYWYAPDDFYARWSTENPDYIDSKGKFISITDVKLSVNWSVKNPGAKAGDFFTVSIGGGIIDPSRMWPLPKTGNITENGDPGGQVIAKYTIDSYGGKGAIVTFEFTDFVEKNSTVHGDFWFGFITSEFLSEEHSREISFSINGQLPVTKPVEVLPPAYVEREPKDSNYDKWGSSDIKNIAGNLYYFTWDIWFNMDFNAVDNFNLEDIIPEESPHRFISPEYAEKLGNSALGKIIVREYTGADEPPYNTDQDTKYSRFKEEFNNSNWYGKLYGYNLYDAPQKNGIDGGNGISAAGFSLSDKKLSVNLGRVTRPTIITYYTVAEIELAENALGSYDTVSQFVNTVNFSTQAIRTASLQTAWFEAGGSGSGYTYGFDFTKVDESGMPLENAGFSLYSDENCTGPVYGVYNSKADGKVSFRHLRHGTYYIKETRPPYGYDPNESIYKVVIGTNGNAEIFHGEGFNNPLPDMKIKNTKTLEPVEITLRAYKMITGEGPELEPGMFSFKLQNSIADDSENYDVAINDEKGVVTFKPLRYTNTGTYHYTISEINDGRDGISYDTSIYDVTVLVEENNGKLEAFDGYDEDEIAFTFTNIYDNQDKKPDPIQISLKAAKALTGEALTDGMFDFQLKENGNVIETVSNNSDGMVMFAPISYMTAGSYEYTINENNDGKPGFAYDETIYKATVTVIEKDGVLEKEVVYSTGNGTEEMIVDEVIFSNSYSPPYTETIPPYTETIPPYTETGSPSIPYHHPITIEDVPSLDQMDSVYIITPEMVPEGYSAVQYDDNTYVIYDEEQLPLGYLTVPEGMPIDDIDIPNEMIPFGKAEIKINPTTGDNSKIFMTGLIVSIFFIVSCTLIIWKKRRLFIP